jgi:hypothetical protein
MIWPFDLSCDGLLVIGLGFVLIMFIGAMQAAEKAVDVAKKVAENETAQEIGKNALEKWLDSIFK